MRRKNTNESQTDYSCARKVLLLSAMLSSILAGGCGADLSSKNAWEKTKSTFKHAYVKTERAVTNTLISIGKYQRDHAYGRESTGETHATDEKSNRNPAPRPPETSGRDEPFPSRTSGAVEENLRPDQARQSEREITRGEAPKEFPLPPRTTMTFEELRQRIRDIEQERFRSKNPDERHRLASELKELERMLLTNQNEENIIEEMTQLRRRLRKLQESLLEIQQTNR